MFARLVAVETLSGSDIDNKLLWFLWLHLFAAYITPSSLPSPMSVGHGQ